MSELVKQLEQLQLAIEKTLRLAREEASIVADSNEGDDKKLCWGKKFSSDEKEAVFWIEEKLGLNADFLMACMAFETGATFDPGIKNAAGSSGTGLIQFMRTTAINLGTTVEDLRKMTRLRQLGYVYKYFAAFGKNLADWELEDLYMAILYPAAIGKSLDWSFPWAASTLAYKQNAGLDKNKDGLITKREASAGVRRMYELGMSPAFLG